MGDSVEDLVSDLASDIGEIVALLRELTDDAIPDAVEDPDLSAKMIAYTCQPGTYKHLLAAIRTPRPSP